MAVDHLRGDQTGWFGWCVFGLILVGLLMFIDLCGCFWMLISDHIKLYGRDWESNS